MIIIGLGIAASQATRQITPGSDTDVCTSKTGDFTQKQLQACFDSQNN